ncbi:MAG: PucR family transcriptional regulator [Oscillospiraceae bacterium]
MSFLVRMILEKDLLPGTRLAAGEKGLDRVVTWVNVMEIMDAPSSIQKGEMVVTTGYHLDKEEAYGGIIARLKNRGAGCLGIQTGYYIEKIPQYILQEAEAEDFPVLEIPKEYTFSNILHTLLDTIGYNPNGKQEGEFNVLAANVAALAAGPWSATQNESDCKTYLLLVSRAQGLQGKKGKLSTKDLRELKTLLQGYNPSLLEELNGDGKVAFALVIAPEAMEEAVFDLTTLVTGLFERESISLYIGIGAAEAPDHLSIALQEATEGIRILKKIKAKRGVCPYWNHTFFELFENIHFNNQLFLLGYRPLQLLFEYDRQYQRDYVRTLRMCLANECNMAKSSARLFIHRHTLNNRLMKIKEISGLDLGDYYGRLYLSLTLLIHDLYAI